MPNPFSYENKFYQTCDVSRVSKFLAHHEMYCKTQHLNGSFVECGVFKGSSFLRFVMFRKIYDENESKYMIGFDTFSSVKHTQFESDKIKLDRFIETAGSKCVSDMELRRILNAKKCGKRVDLIKGDICKTVPNYVEENPGLKISLLNLDTDIYESAVIILKYLYPKIQPGGIMLIDNYNEFPGETLAINEYFKDKNIRIQQSSIHPKLYYIVKS